MIADDTERDGVAAHAMLIAVAAVRQAGTPTARLAGRIATGDGGARVSAHPLVAAFAHADAAVAAAGPLAGSFHPRIAARCDGRRQVS